MKVDQSRSYIYVMGVASDRRSKIGISGNPVERLSVLRRSHPDYRLADLRYAVHSPISLVTLAEAHIGDTFDAFALGEEWFGIACDDAARAVNTSLVLASKGKVVSNKAGVRPTVASRIPPEKIPYPKHRKRDVVRTFEEVLADPTIIPSDVLIDWNVDAY